jgi:hypothetical protein
MDQIHLSPLVDQIQLALGHISNKKLLIWSLDAPSYYQMIWSVDASICFQSRKSVETYEIRKLNTYDGCTDLMSNGAGSVGYPRTYIREG